MSGSPRPTICRICNQNCGILVSNENGRLKITGNKDHPVTGGFICFRGAQFNDVYSAPDRLSRPRLKKNGSWVEIDYEEALDLMAERLLEIKKKHGPASVAFLKGESLKHQEMSEYMRHLLYGFGSPNYTSVGSICHWSLGLGHGLTFGGFPKPDFTRVKTIILWGGNPAVSLVRLWSNIREALKLGVKLVVIDPVRTESAELADVHLPLRPASDGFLALALIKRAVEKYDLAPPESQARGWEDMKKMVRELSHRSLLKETGLEESLFDRASDLIFSHLPAWTKVGSGLELHPFGVQAIRSVVSFQSLLDTENYPGPKSAPIKPLPGKDRYPDLIPAIGQSEHPIFVRAVEEGQGMRLTRAILQEKPYPIRAMFIAGANPVMTYPAWSQQKAAMEKLEFSVVFDLFMTQTAQLADLVLPAASHLEVLELHDYGEAGPPFLGLVQPVVDSGRGWPLWKVVFSLARRLGLHDLFPWPDNNAAIKDRISGTGVDFEALLKSPSSALPYRSRPVAETFWRTTPGEVHFVSRVVESSGIAGLPSPGIFNLPFYPDDRYPLWLNTGDRVRGFQHSQYRNIPKYLAHGPGPKIDVHPRTALGLGIGDGETVVIETRDGRIECAACLTERVRPDLIRMTHGWEEANANALTGIDYLDPISGFPWLKALPARLEKKE